MAIVNKVLRVFNITHQIYDVPRVLSIAGDNNANYDVPIKSDIQFDLITVQFDEIFLDTLSSYVNQGLAQVTLDGSLQSASDVGNLKYAGTAGGGGSPPPAFR